MLLFGLDFVGYICTLHKRMADQKYVLLGIGPLVTLSPLWSSERHYTDMNLHQTNIYVPYFSHCFIGLKRMDVWRDDLFNLNTAHTLEHYNNNNNNNNIAFFPKQVGVGYTLEHYHKKKHWNITYALVALSCIYVSISFGRTSRIHTNLKYLPCNMPSCESRSCLTLFISVAICRAALMRYACVKHSYL